jgi:hypothetical protein
MRDLSFGDTLIGDEITFSTFLSNGRCYKELFWGRILGRNPDKSLKSFPPCFLQSPLYIFALRFIFLQTHATSYSFLSSITVHVKEKGAQPERKSYPLLHGLRNPSRNLKSGKFQDYPQKRQWYVREFGFCCRL